MSALKAFDAVVRLGSMNRAENELGIAPSSVTQHIRNLEDHVGGDLFERSANAISLNKRGEIYSKEILRAFDTIHQATGVISQNVSGMPLRVSCVPTLAGPWLAEQLAVIESEFPGQEIHCEFSTALADFDTDNVDIAIRYGAGNYSGATAELLYTDTIAPVCTPQTAQNLRNPNDLCDILRLDSVENAPSGLSIWRHWASLAVGDTLEMRLKAKCSWILQSSAFSMEILHALPSVAILERSMVQQHLVQGTLVAPFDMWVPAPCGYYVVTSSRRVLQPAAKRLKSLLKRSVADQFHQPATASL